MPRIAPAATRQNRGITMDLLQCAHRNPVLPYQAARNPSRHAGTGLYSTI